MWLNPLWWCTEAHYKNQIFFAAGASVHVVKQAARMPKAVCVHICHRPSPVCHFPHFSSFPSNKGLKKTLPVEMGFKKNFSQDQSLLTEEQLRYACSICAETCVTLPPCFNL